MHKKIDINLVTKIKIAKCKTEADMYLYEIYYINLLKPVFNCDDKAHDELSIVLPKLDFEEYQPKLFQKWKAQITEKEAEKQRKEQELSDWQKKHSENRKILKGDDWFNWLDNNPRPSA